MKCTNIFHDYMHPSNVVKSNKMQKFSHRFGMQGNGATFRLRAGVFFFYYYCCNVVGKMY